MADVGTPVLYYALTAAAAGAVGGLVKCLMDYQSNKPAIPKDRETIAQAILLVATAVILGAVAAFLSWALYGPLATSDVMTACTTTTNAPFAWSALAASIAIGTGGAGWISAELDKQKLKHDKQGLEGDKATLKQVAVDLAHKNNPQMAQQIGGAKSAAQIKAIVEQDLLDPTKWSEGPDLSGSKSTGGK
jgi:hypothetical protein